MGEWLQLHASFRLGGTGINIIVKATALVFRCRFVMLELRFENALGGLVT